MGKYTVLTEEQVQSFLDKGYLVVKDCRDTSIANRWVDEAYDRLGYSKHDPTTWQKDIVWMDPKNELPVRELAPKAWASILDVIVGEDRLETQVMGIGPGHFTSINSF